MNRTFFVAALLAPALALAQTQALEKAKDTQRVVDEGAARREGMIEKNDGPGDGAAPAEAGGAAASSASLEAGVAAPDEGRGTVPPPDTYTVRPGDTLWDLSGRFLNNPWYWPKIWAYNPAITNPHWIEPGNLLRFYASGDEGPAQVEPAGPVAEQAEDAGDDGASARELEDLARVDMKTGPSEDVQDAVAVVGPNRIGVVAKRTQWALHDAFVTPRELAESGAIEAAFEEKLLLGVRDRAYAHFTGATGVKVGETYAIYKTEREVVHPVSGDVIGYQSTILGAAKVVAVGPQVATLTITAASDAIERGALLGPWVEKPYRAVPEKPNAKSLEGVVIASPIGVLTQFAEAQMVFIDRGKADGVEPGNRFVVVRKGDPYGKPLDRPDWDDHYPLEDVGSLLVVDVKDNASAALVTRSLAEIIKGDRVEMRAAR